MSVSILIRVYLLPFHFHFLVNYNLTGLTLKNLNGKTTSHSQRKRGVVWILRCKTNLVSWLADSCCGGRRPADPAIETIISKLVEAAGLLDTLIVLFVREGKRGGGGRVEMEPQSTYIHRAPQCMSPRRNWDSPNPSPASECALPPPGPKGGGDKELYLYT